MAPPVASSSWYVGRRFGIVIDAGSSGSRLQIYSWHDPRTTVVEKDGPLAYTLPKVEKGTQDDELWQSKVEPGLSSLAGNVEGVAAYLRPLLHHAREHIPPSLQHETPLFLLATAGMRLLPPEDQADILQETCRFLVLHSRFKIDAPSVSGPCGSSVRVITGEEEGLFGWLAVNYLMDGFSGAGKNRTTYGFLDMGGASTQIAFEPIPEHRTDDLVDVRLRFLGGQEIHHKVFVSTWLGYGTNQARERYVGKTIMEYEAARVEGQTDDAVPDPCLPVDLILTESSFQSSAQSDPQLHKIHKLIGTGSYEQCLEKTSSLLNQSTPCPDTPCLMNGVHVPPIDFSVSHFIGVSEYWYSSEHVFGLGGPYDYVQYERAASEFCKRDWAGIMKQHEESRQSHRLGGDGEVEEDGKIVRTGVWGPEVELRRLQMQCFKSAWIVNVLHEGLSLPRILDPGGNVTAGNTVAEEAEKKGLGRPTFQSVSSVGDIAFSWTLGKMVLEASKEISSFDGPVGPHVDPYSDVEDLTNLPPKSTRPIFSLDALGNSTTLRLPGPLTRSWLGFPPLLILVLLSLLAYPMRRHLRALFLRVVRRVTKCDATYPLQLEDGNGSMNALDALTPSGSRWIQSFKRAVSLNRHSKKSSMVVGEINLRHMPSAVRGTPARSASMPAESSSVLATSSSQYLQCSLSRAPSPTPRFMDDGVVYASRSCNASNLSLSSVGTRSQALSRVNSTHYLNGSQLSQGE